MPSIQKSGDQFLQSRRDVAALDALAALSHSSRLRIFRYLASHAMPANAGQISQAMGIAPGTLSSHLAILVRAKLISGQKDGRNSLYRPNFGAMSGLVRYLLDDCCSGRAEAVTALIKTQKVQQHAA